MESSDQKNGQLLATTGNYVHLPTSVSQSKHVLIRKCTFATIHCDVWDCLSPQCHWSSLAPVYISGRWHLHGAMADGELVNEHLSSSQCLRHRSGADDRPT